MIQNAQAYVPKKSMVQNVIADIRSILNDRSRTDAETQLKQAAITHRKTAPKLANWMVLNVPESITVFDFPASHWEKLEQLTESNDSIEKLPEEHLLL